MAWFVQAVQDAACLSGTLVVENLERRVGYCQTRLQQHSAGTGSHRPCLETALSAPVGMSAGVLQLCFIKYRRMNLNVTELVLHSRHGCREGAEVGIRRTLGDTCFSESQGVPAVVPCGKTVLDTLEVVCNQSNECKPPVVLNSMCPSLGTTSCNAPLTVRS